MASGKSARRLLQFLKPTDAPTISAWSEALVAQLDNDVEGGQGTLAERPAAKLRGRIWVVQGDATAANNGIAWWDTGATWVRVDGTAVTPVSIAGPYGAQVERAGLTELEPSATRPTMVLLTLEGKSSAVLGATLKVGGVIVQKANIAPPGAGIPILALAFICPPGVKWEITAAVNLEKILSSYLTL